MEILKKLSGKGTGFILDGLGMRLIVTCGEKKEEEYIIPRRFTKVVIDGAFLGRNITMQGRIITSIDNAMVIIENEKEKKIYVRPFSDTTFSIVTVHFETLMDILLRYEEQKADAHFNYLSTLLKLQETWHKKDVPIMEKTTLLCLQSQSHLYFSTSSRVYELRIFIEKYLARKVKEATDKKSN